MRSSSWATRLPFYYGWVVAGVAFVTMGIGVNTRTAFSLLYPAILDEFGWARGATAGVFAFGFIASMLVTPFVGTLMERFGPRVLIPFGALLCSTGLVLTTMVSQLWLLYLTLGALTVGGSMFLSYIGHAAFLPFWFVRRRGLVLGLIFSGVGVGGIVLFPLLQRYILAAGWRESCIALALLMLLSIVPLNLLAQRRRPEDLGLKPDGVNTLTAEPAARASEHRIADSQWVAIEWDYGRILREPRFWAVAVGYFCSLYCLYAVQVHQTKYYLEAGLDAETAALALGLVVLLGIPGQICIGSLSDRIGREIAWSIAMLGYAVCLIGMLLLARYQALWLMYVSVAGLGLLGAGTAPLFSSIGAELFAGPYFGRVYGLLGAASALGAASGAWLTGQIYDVFGRYDPAFLLGLVFALVSAVCIWVAAPGRVRPVPGRRRGIGCEGAP